MSRGLLCFMLLFLWACTSEPPSSEKRPAAQLVLQDTMASKPELSNTAVRFSGVLLVGGRFTLGDTVGQDLASMLNMGVDFRNAAIKGETLSSMLERLPYLLEQQPKMIVLELGQEDELAQTRLAVFKRDLRRLQRLLGDIPYRVLCTAQQPDYRAALKAFAESERISLTLLTLDENKEKENQEIVRAALEE